MNFKEYSNYNTKQADLYDQQLDLFVDNVFSLDDFPNLEGDDLLEDFNEHSATVHQTPPTQELNEKISEDYSENAKIASKNLAQVDISDAHTSDEFMGSLLENVRKEIDLIGLDSVIDHCVDHQSTSKVKENQFVRDRHEKTESQVKAMVEALEDGQTQLPRSKRVKLGRKIHLSESQIYKWYYDTYKQ